MLNNRKNELLIFTCQILFLQAADESLQQGRPSLTLNYLSSLTVHYLPYSSDQIGGLVWSCIENVSAAIEIPRSSYFTPPSIKHGRGFPTINRSDGTSSADRKFRLSLSVSPVRAARTHLPIRVDRPRQSDHSPIQGTKHQLGTSSSKDLSTNSQRSWACPVQQESLLFQPSFRL